LAASSASAAAELRNGHVPGDADQLIRLALGEALLGHEEIDHLLDRRAGGYVQVGISRPAGDYELLRAMTGGTTLRGAPRDVGCDDLA
jgi:hypothetical protein